MHNIIIAMNVLLYELKRKTFFTWPNILGVSQDGAQHLRHL